MSAWVVDLAGLVGLSALTAGVSLRWGYDFGLMVFGVLVLFGAALAAWNRAK